MAKTSSLSESCLLLAVKAAAIIFRAMPFPVACGVARVMGCMAYYVAHRKRGVAYANVRTVFAGRRSPKELAVLTRGAFANIAQSFVEILCLPKIGKKGLNDLVDIRGREHVDKALAGGKGIIFLALHSGNWELASIGASMCGCPYNVVANYQSKMPRLADLLTSYRFIAGAKVIEPGSATRDILRALKNNEAVSLVLDQGGKDGTPVKFLGRTASMSTGAIRMGLKYGIPICPVWIARTRSGKHELTVYPALELAGEEANDRDVTAATRQASAVFEKLVYEYPDEYLWFYKVFKYSTEASILILDDMKTGHLRQSQAVADIIKASLGAKGKTVEIHTVSSGYFKSGMMRRLFAVYAFAAQFILPLRREDALDFFLTPEALQQLAAVRGDYVVSCGSKVGGVNFMLSRSYGAKAVCVLKPGLLSWSRFDLAVFPEHDRPKVPIHTRFVMTKAAPNMITPAYLKKHVQQLELRFSHLKGNIRTKIGVLIGGDTKGVKFTEAQARLLMRQLKETAAHYNIDLLVTTSRRTSAAVDEIVSREMKNFDHCALCVIANEKNVEEAVGGILGLCDMVVVSGESISMVSEAVSSGKRTVVFSPTGDYTSEYPASKYDRFVLTLNEGQFLLACAIKDISATIAGMLRQKLVLRRLDDRAMVAKAVEEII